MFSIYELETRVLLRCVFKNDRNEIILISKYINDKKKKKKRECQSKSGKKSSNGSMART
jgi:hypothetical protein